MKKTIQLNKGMFLATLIVGMCAFSLSIVSVLITISSILNVHQYAVNGFNWFRIIFNASQSISLLVLLAISLAKNKDTSTGGREIIRLFDLFTTIEGGCGVLVYGFNLIEVATYNGSYFFNLLLNMFFCVFGVIALLFLDKEGNIGKILALVSAFLIGGITLYNVFRLSFTFWTFERLTLLAYIVLNIVCMFMMKEGNKEILSPTNEENNEQAQ